MTKVPPSCPKCAKQTRAGIAGGRGDPPLVPLFICYECNQALVVGASDAVTWWLFWTLGRVEADGKWVDVSELTQPEPASAGGNEEGARRDGGGNEEGKSREEGGREEGARRDEGGKEEGDAAE